MEIIEKNTNIETINKKNKEATVKEEPKIRVIENWYKGKAYWVPRGDYW